MSDDGEETTTGEFTLPAAEAGRTPASRHFGLLQIFPKALDVASPVWSISGPATLGRHRGSEVLLTDPRVSREHLRLLPAEGGLSVRDLSSRHGTFVDGRRLGFSEQRVPCGSTLRCGDSLFLVVAEPERWDGAPRRLKGVALGLEHDLIAGPTLFRAWQHATQVAELQKPMLVLGESGVGKEAVARLAHASRKRPGPFVALNLAAIPAGLFESELFGHVRGSFTGATSNRPGAFREAAGGVLFLDEIGELRPELQSKLLRAIEESRIRPVGADADVMVNVRVVAATSRDLRAGEESSEFRRDLFYRLSAFTVEVAPLRERRDEIVILALDYLRSEAPGLRLSTCAAELLANLPWKGNVRELQHAMARASLDVLASGERTIRASHFPGLAPETIAETSVLGAEAVTRALAGASGNASRAAKSLGISRATLYNFCDREGLNLSVLRAAVRNGHVARVR